MNEMFAARNVWALIGRIEAGDRRRSLSRYLRRARRGAPRAGLVVLPALRPSPGAAQALVDCPPQPGTVTLAWIAAGMHAARWDPRARLEATVPGLEGNRPVPGPGPRARPTSAWAGEAGCSANTAWQLIGSPWGAET